MNFEKENGRIFVRDGEKLLAEITYTVKGDVADIDHTFVDESLRGMGVASKLVEMAVEDIKSKGLNIVASCTYANKWLSKNNMI
ncbi:MAG: GNAT family N-acetyltransferase [Erysipelotrichaceae bacterium]|nr:GNAT family N-acetyltransferase [Erysipelotrichaceae bacterium]